MTAPTGPGEINRRDAAVLIGATAALSAIPARASTTSKPKEDRVTLTCFIRYQIDPFQKEAFRSYAEAWGSIIPRLGGHLVGYFLPDEGTNDIAFALIAFANLAAYEAYRTRLKADPEARKNLAMAQERKLILREERSFLEAVAGTFERPALPG